MSQKGEKERPQQDKNMHEAVYSLRGFCAESIQCFISGTVNTVIYDPLLYDILNRALVPEAA